MTRKKGQARVVRRGAQQPRPHGHHEKAGGSGWGELSGATLCLHLLCSHESFLFACLFSLRLIYLWLHCIFIAACRPSPVAANGGYSLVAMPGLLIAAASLIVEHRLQTCSLQQL